ncbi:unnamed protein product [Kuraishia capsulata CBS 1993]|uniref:Oligomycin resistance ATP-dependent permease YOR1 n=1 Tax=Kuraishia capsulata CBS 1993 TaxID=1382522 RepID=W6MHP5_9ASCO|nr:uncharacterized protein KUCA_T00001799001 [Kuraishia capsulata CBS 1993]CDK25829.1 unnamed protein product [Kuraishia capsulata CBS 1993]
MMATQKPQRRLITWLLNKRVPPIPSEEEKRVLPEAAAGLINRTLVIWAFPFMMTGYKRLITENDLYLVPENAKVDNMDIIFQRNFSARMAKSAPGEYSRWILMLSLWDTFKWEYVWCIWWKLLSDLLSVTSPLLSRELIRYVETRTKPVGVGVGYAIGTTLFIFFRGLLQAHFFTGGQSVGIKMRSVLTKAVFDKSFQLDEAGRHEFPTSTITSIMGTDLARIEFALTYMGNIITLPITFCISLAFLIVYIGPVSLSGVAVFLLIMFLVVYQTKYLMQFRRRASLFTDQRVSYVKELLNNIKMIKYYSWEDSYIAKVTKIRNAEMSELMKIQSGRAIAVALTLSIPYLSSMVAFLAMWGVEGLRSVADIFTSLTFFNVLAQQVLIVPMSLSSTADMIVGLERTRKLLLCNEIDPAEDYKNLDYPEDRGGDSAIIMKEASFAWGHFEDEDNTKKKKTESLEQGTITMIEHSESSNKLLENLPHSSNSSSSCQPSTHSTNSNHSQTSISETEKLSGLPDPSIGHNRFTGLHNVNLDLARGEFVVITGMIGCGKTSLLNAMARRMKQESGLLEVNGSLLLCGFPWVQNQTVRENITFGKPFDQDKYDTVIHACALEDDLKLFEAGDMTEVGERGITLSGGQKARLNLARAVYADPDILLLDDVLSAVDARVGKHIMNECILGILKDRTRVLATHQLSLIGAANRVVFLDGDGEVAIGSIDELKATRPNFVKLMEYSNQHDKANKAAESEEEQLKTIQVISRQQSNLKESGTLIKAEQLSQGVGLLVYRRFIWLGAGKLGIFAIPLVLLAVVLSSFMQMFSNVWLSFWTESKFPISNGTYIGLYVLFTCLILIFVAILFALMAYITNRSAELLNVRSMIKILHAPMSYFDTTPMGRIINRFTKDTDVADNELTNQVRLLIYAFALIVATLIMCIIYIPWFAIAIPPLLLVYVIMSDFYLASSKPVKNLEAIKRSFVYNNFNESLTGMETIKAYGLTAVRRFMETNAQSLDRMNEASFLQLATRNWIAVYINVISTSVVFLVAILSVTGAFSIGAASVGLLMSYTLQISGYLSFVIRSITMVEGYMVSVQRLVEYAYDLVQEADYESSPGNEVADSWPTSGAIEFQNVSMRYRPTLPIVLKNVSFAAEASEKIGICGRTGAGKSTITSALYRFVEIEEGGKMLIDGVDISKIGLRPLRSRLSIIPQDPVLFKGTIRENLDPFKQKTDNQLWDALRRSGVVEETQLALAKSQNNEGKFEMHKFHLDQHVEDGGSNFSLGERQLIALARALVRDSKILILDEATSSVDYETDSKIQKTIATEFAACTILCVAHRLKTIVNYDRIMVLDKGEIIEMDKPWKLFQTGGVFRDMCDKSGIVEEDFETK